MITDQFSYMYEKYHQLSVQTAFRLSQNHAVADDVAQEVFFHLYMVQDMLDFQNERKLRSLIILATINKTKDYFRKPSQKNEGGVMPDDRYIEDTDERKDPEEVMLANEKTKYRKLILDMLRQKNQVSYEMLIKVSVFELQPETVAREYGTTRNNVNNRVMRARNWMKEELRRMLDGLPNPETEK